MDIFIEPVTAKPRILILGRSPVARTLARLAAAVDFSVSVAAPEASPANFPDADVVLDDLRLGEVKIGPQTFVVVSTQGEQDEEGLKLALSTEAAYIAFVASRTKAEKILKSFAAQGATGKWILSTDADVVFHPSLLRQAVELAQRKNVQFLSLTPEVEMQSWAEKVVLPAFGFLLFMLFPLRRVNDPRSSRAMAAGAFLLMRHEDLIQLGGDARLRDTLIEDLRMAELFKRNGRRTYLGVTRGVFHTRMYENWREVFEGLTRSAWEGAGCSLWKVLAGVAAGTGMAVLPWLSLAALWLSHLFTGVPLAHNPVFIAAAAATAASAAVYCPVVVFAGVSPLYTFTLPLASLFYSTVAVVSAFRSLTGPGLRWKGRSYQPPAA